jgi:AcrR family transcriptional regulator
MSMRTGQGSTLLLRRTVPRIAGNAQSAYIAVHDARAFPVLLVSTPAPLRSGAVTDPTSPVDVLLDAAFRVFAAQGYRATRLEDVAEAAGVTKGAIYHYFNGKEDLLRRAVQSRHRAMFAEIEAALVRERAPAAAKIRFVLRKVWLHWMVPEWGQAFRLLVGELSIEFPALFRMWAEEGPVHGWALVRQLIEEGVKGGEFRADVDPEVAARLVVSGLMLQAALQVHLGLAELAPCDADRIFDSAVELFLHGLAVTHGPPPRS